MMKSIHQNREYSQAMATLREIRGAIASANLEEARLSAALATPEPSTTSNALQNALNIVANKAAERVDATGMLQSLRATREKIDILQLGLDEQARVVLDLEVKLSGQACTDIAPDHGRAVQGIVDALQQLKVALAAEAAIRADLLSNGYRCIFPALAVPALDFNSSDSPVSLHLRECENYATDVADTISGAIDKAATVLMLAAFSEHKVGEVVTLPGRVARSYVRLGRAEYTTAKPRNPMRDAAPAREVVLS